MYIRTSFFISICPFQNKRCKTHRSFEKKYCRHREGTNKLESAFINKPLLSMSEVHVCFCSREHCIESFFFFLLRKTALHKSSKKKWNRCIDLPINSMIVKKKKNAKWMFWFYLFIFYFFNRKASSMWFKWNKAWIYLYVELTVL